MKTTHPASQAVPILAVARALGIELHGRRASCFNAAAHGGGTDARPSLVFYQNNNQYHCFACGVHGDAINLVRAILQLDFRAAVAWIMGLAGGAPPGTAKCSEISSAGARTPDRAAIQVYETLYAMTSAIGPDTPAGLFLRGRQIDLKLANDHHARQIQDPQSLWDGLTKSFGFERLHDAGLVSRSNRFLFARHCLLFFYFCPGSPVFVQARDITGQAHSKELSLAGLHSAVPYNIEILDTRAASVAICEGCIDTLSALQMGFPAIGVPGVTGFRQEWFEFFRRVGQVNVVFDNDDAGRRQGIELRSQFRRRGVKADCFHPTSVKDLNDILKEKGQD